MEGIRKKDAEKLAATGVRSEVASGLRDGIPIAMGYFAVAFSLGIIAKNAGAKKVISLTHRPEYIRIAREMGTIDCAFSATLVAANSVLRLLEGTNKRVDVQLQSFNAAISEFRILRSSPLCGKTLAAAKIPASLVLALVFRGNELFAPAGDTVLLEGDIAVAVVTRDMHRTIDKMFPSK